MPLVDELSEEKLVELLEHYRQLCAKQRAKEQSLCGEILDNLSPLDRIVIKADNRVCADCAAHEPKWASTNLGIFICIRCSGVHRSLGVHISKVCSLVIDSWSPEHIAFVSKRGNLVANKEYEASVPHTYKKPHLDSTM